MPNPLYFLPHKTIFEGKFHSANKGSSNRKCIEKIYNILFDFQLKTKIFVRSLGKWEAYILHKEIFKRMVYAICATGYPPHSPPPNPPNKDSR